MGDTPIIVKSPWKEYCSWLGCPWYTPSIRAMYVPSMINAQLLSQWARILVYFSPFAISIQLKVLQMDFMLLHSLPTWEILLWGALSFMSEGSVLVFTEKQLLIWGCLSTRAGAICGPSSSSGSVYLSIPYP